MIYIKPLTRDSWRSLKVMPATEKREVILTLTNGIDIPMPIGISVKDTLKALKIRVAEVQAVTLGLSIRTTDVCHTTVTAYERGC